MLLVLDPVVLHFYCAVFLEGSPNRLNLIFNVLFLRGPTSTSVSRTLLRMELHRLCGSKRVVQSSEFEELAYMVHFSSGCAVTGGCGGHAQQQRSEQASHESGGLLGLRGWVRVAIQVPIHDFQRSRDFIPQYVRHVSQGELTCWVEAWNQ